MFVCLDSQFIQEISKQQFLSCIPLAFVLHLFEVDIITYLTYFELIKLLMTKTAAFFKCFKHVLTYSLQENYKIGTASLEILKLNWAYYLYTPVMESTYFIYRVITQQKFA